MRATQGRGDAGAAHRRGFARPTGRRGRGRPHERQRPGSPPRPKKRARGFARGRAATGNLPPARSRPGQRLRITYARGALRSCFGGRSPKGRRFLRGHLPRSLRASSCLVSRFARLGGRRSGRGDGRALRHSRPGSLLPLQRGFAGRGGLQPSLHQSAGRPRYARSPWPASVRGRAKSARHPTPTLRAARYRPRASRSPEKGGSGCDLLFGSGLLAGGGPVRRPVVGAASGSGARGGVRRAGPVEGEPVAGQLGRRAGAVARA